MQCAQKRGDACAISCTLDIPLVHRDTHFHHALKARVIVGEFFVELFNGVSQLFGMLCLAFMASSYRRVCHLFYLLSRDNYHD